MGLLLEIRMKKEILGEILGVCWEDIVNSGCKILGFG
jgi:hypothetical protein